MRHYFAFLAWTALSVPSIALAQQIPAAIEGQDLSSGNPLKFKVQGSDLPTVVVFLSAKCPCSASHEPALSALAQEFGKDVRFVGVNSNADETLEAGKTHFKQAALPFPVIRDGGAKIAGQFGALKTPHVYVLGKDGKVLFQGGVDDSHDATLASKAYLKDALQAVKGGRAPAIAQARAIGCKIAR